MSYCILDVRDISIEGSKFNIENINLNINEGQILGIVGPNGSGKSTIAKAIVGIKKINSGKILVNKIEQKNNNEDIKQYIGYVSKDISLDKTIKCIDYCEIAKKYYENWNDILFSSLIDEFDFNLSKKIGDLSNGNLIKFQLILAISQNPKLLIVDDIPKDINPLVKNHILQRIKVLVKESKCCALLISDKTEDLYKVCDTVSYIHNGKIVMTGTKQNKLKDYEKCYNC